MGRVAPGGLLLDIRPPQNIRGLRFNAVNVSSQLAGLTIPTALARSWSRIRPCKW